jgi:hypothetical protein
MSKWPMRGHFLYLRFKTFPMTPRTLQCEVFWALLSNSKHSGVSEDSKSPTLEVLDFTLTLGQSGVATPYVHDLDKLREFQMLLKGIGKIRIQWLQQIFQLRHHMQIWQTLKNKICPMGHVMLYHHVRKNNSFLT